ncbi:MAG: class II aldolase/adducin family protein [Candidatus Limnocylindrales bacterium]
MDSLDPLAGARRAVVAAGVRLGARGLVVASEGNVSLRTAEGILITPSGRRKDELAVADLVVVEFVVAEATEDGATHSSDDATAEAERTGSSRPSSDIAIHRAIYAARPDAAAIVHAHLAASLALTTVGELPDPAELPETARFIGRLPFVPFFQPGSAALAAAVAAALTDRGPDGLLAPPDAVLLERHGAIAVGADLVTAGDRLELVDLLCRVHRDVVLLRSAARR